MSSKIYDYEERIERYRRIISSFGHNGGTALRFLDHLASLGLSVARVSKIASHLPALLRVIDFKLEDATRQDVEALFPPNIILGTTVETNRSGLCRSVSRAPPPDQRLTALAELKAPFKMVSVEPVLDFDMPELAEMIAQLRPNFVSIGADSGGNDLPEFMQIYEYSHVQHIVSRVIGRLRKDCSCYDVLRAVFPAGTVSGAPKVRAMEIIEESEPARRGPYTGAVGYFSYNGNADFAIIIRTLIAKDGEAYIQVGAGIVANSIPEREWFETEHKASALFRALEKASEDKTP